MTEKTPVEVLTAARAHLSDPANWNRDGRYFKGGNRDTGCACAYGAIALIADISGDDARDLVAAKYLMRALPSGWRFIALFNDHPDTTHADILALYDRAIALAKEGGGMNPRHKWTSADIAQHTRAASGPWKHKPRNPRQGYSPAQLASVALAALIALLAVSQVWGDVMEYQAAEIAANKGEN